TPKVRPSTSGQAVAEAIPWPGGPDLLAEDRGFEPLRVLTHHDFQSAMRRTELFGKLQRLDPLGRRLLANTYECQRMRLNLRLNLSTRMRLDRMYHAAADETLSL